MKHLYIGQTNAQNFAILRDFDRGEDDSAVIDYDLTDDEIRELYAREEELTAEEWETFDAIRDRMTAIQTAASYLEEE